MPEMLKEGSDGRVARPFEEEDQLIRSTEEVKTQGKLREIVDMEAVEEEAKQKELIMEVDGEDTLRKKLKMRMRLTSSLVN